MSMVEDLEDEKHIRLAAAELSIVYKKKAEEVKGGAEIGYREKCLASSKQSEIVKRKEWRTTI